MHILVSGGTGFIGQALLPALENQGHSVILLSRQSNPCEGRYPSARSPDEIAADTNIDAIINLAGASMAGKRWSTPYKKELVESRLGITESLLALVRRLKQPPATFLSASAIGYYGHHGDEPLDESGACVDGFAQSLCARWESAAMQAAELGVRTCLMRLGVVLDAGGGAFEQMAAPFKWGVGNWIGDGRQWLSWIHREDAVAAILYLLEHETVSGPFNLTAPQPVTARAFCQAMKRQKSTLVTLPVPAPVMRLMIGEMADELLINGQRVVPSALQQAGFRFRYESVDDALRAICQR
jgi:uncharacterized protein (TIGR01777 family)